jgi:glyoxylase-like metal-dependent hydrolase (beta-lactamase superfamily II)
MRQLAVLAVVTAVGAIAVGAFARSQTESQGTEGPSARSYREARAILDEGLKALGGVEALRGVRDLTIREKGRHQWIYQSESIAPPWRTGAREETTIVDFSRNRLVIDTRVSAPEYYFGWSGSLVDGDQGYTLDHYSEMAAPMQNPSLANFRSHLYQRLPHQVLIDALERAPSLRLLGRAERNGSPYDVVSYVSFEGRHITLCFDARTHLLARWEYLYSDSTVGDSIFAMTFAGYRPVGGVQLPTRRRLLRSGDWQIDTEYVEVRLNTDPAGELFRVPEGYVHVPAPTPRKEPSITEVATDVFFLEGLGASGRYNALFVAFEDHVLAVNAPVPASVSADFIARIRRAVPNKPIRYLALTHHAYDHVAGLRAFVAEGVKILATPNVSRFARKLVEASFTMEPDALARAPRAIQIEPVAGGRRVLEDGSHRVELIDLGPSATADEMVVVFLPAHGLLFQADLLNPNYAQAYGRAQPGEIFLESRLRALNLKVDRILGGHGGVVDRDVLHRSIERTENLRKPSPSPGGR